MVYKAVPVQPTMHIPKSAQPHRPAALPWSGSVRTGMTCSSLCICRAVCRPLVSPSHTSPLTLGLFPQHLVQQEVR